MKGSYKYILMVVAIPTIVWLVLLYIVHFSSTDNVIGIIGISGIVTEIPIWAIHIFVLVGYLLSLIIGFVIFYEKKHWKLL